MENNNNRVNGQNNTVKRRKRKKLRLKKSVRRTMGCLLLVTSLIVAAIPTGSASADSGDPGASAIPSLDTIIKNASLSNHTDEFTYNGKKGTSVSNTSSAEEIGAYQLSVEDDGTGQYRVVTTTIGGEPFNKVDREGMFINDSVKKPIFKVFFDSSRSSYVISKFIQLTNFTGTQIKINSYIGYNEWNPDSSVKGNEYVEKEWYENGYKYKLVKKKIDNERTTDGTISVNYIQASVLTLEEVQSTVGMDGAAPMLLNDMDGLEVYSFDEDDYKDEALGGDEVDGILVENQEIQATDKESSNEEVDSSDADIDIDIEADSGSSSSSSSSTEASIESSLEIEDKDTNKMDNSSSTSSSSSSKIIMLDNNLNEDDNNNESLENESVDLETAGLGFDFAPHKLLLADEPAPDKYYTVVFKDFDGKTIEADTQKVKHGEKATKPSVDPSAGDYEFSGNWSIDLSTTPILEDTVVYPKYWRVDDTKTDIVCEKVGNVTALANDSFSSNTNLDTIDMPYYSLIEDIGDSAFRGNTNIKTISFNSNLAKIGKQAFENCINLSTVNYPLSPKLKVIGDGAFSNTKVSTFTCPNSLEILGCGAFYGCKALNDINLSTTNQCKFGSYIFANCTALNYVDFDRDEDKAAIEDLDKSNGLFAGCNKLIEVHLPESFEGTLMSGVFAECPAMSLLEVRNDKVDYADHEFDKAAKTFEVTGPQPIDLDPAVTPNTNAFIRSLKNTYPYRYTDGNGVTYYYNQLRYLDDKGDIQPAGYIVEVKVEPDGTGTLTKAREIMSAIGDEFPEAAGDLQINEVLGLLSIKRIADKDELSGKGVFEGMTHPTSIYIPTSVNVVGTNAFKSCENVKSIEMDITDGINLKESAFENCKKLDTVTFDQQSGTSGYSSIGDYCFKNCWYTDTDGTHSLKFVNFENDDYNKNDIMYAPISSIGRQAFYNDIPSREDLIFKGPMFGPLADGSREGYVPYLYAITPTNDHDKWICNQQSFIVYKSGNPQNLEVRYHKMDTTHEKDGVYLESYPNQTTTVNGTAVASANGTRVSELSANSGHISGVQDEIVRCTSNIVVPYGVNYIDNAISAIEDKQESYVKFDDATSLYDDKNTASHIDTAYYQFKYVNGLKTVTFEDGGVHVFPERLFEGAPNLESVVFEGDVERIGKLTTKTDGTQRTSTDGVASYSGLPFYWPDTEDVTSKATTFAKTFPHGYANPPVQSKVYSVEFKNEAPASKNNPAYSCYQDFANGIGGVIISDDGTDKAVEQILPGRGYIDEISKKELGPEEFSGVTLIKKEAARDCDKINKVDLSESKANIEEKAFYDCDELVSVEIPAESIYLRDGAFGAITGSMDISFNQFPEHYTLADEIFGVADDDFITKNPLVTFHYHDGADSLKQYAEKRNANDNKGNILIGTPLTDIFDVHLTYDDGSVIYDYTDVSTGTLAVSLTDPYDPPTIPPTRNGQAFDGWYISGVKVTNSTQLTKETTIIAKYADNSVRFIFVPSFDTTQTLYSRTVFYGNAINWPADPVVTGKNFSHWSPNLNGEIINQTDYPVSGSPYTITAVFIDPTGTPTTTPTGTPTTTPTGTPTATPTPSSSSTSSSSSSSKSTSSSTARSSSSSTSRSSSTTSQSKASSSAVSIATPYYITSQDAGAAGGNQSTTVYINNGSGNGGNGGNGGSNGSGNTRVENSRDGISDSSKISATVNGSTDNYVVKITRTQEADDCALQALTGAYGDISPIRYLPFDISLYDSTGTNKISPLPEGVTVTVTMPIPDDLAVYGGNAKVASTVNGQLETIQPRFTMINDVPCMTFTLTHLSPYMVYVDTANLTAAGISDATPKTADPIHPKWFLCIGLAALAIVLLIKKDPEEYIKGATA